MSREICRSSRCSTARPASCRPGRRRASGSPRRFSNAPELLLLDEPTASLDPDTADWIRRKLRDYARDRGATLLLASHNMAEVERLADRVILLDQGRIIEDETPRALIETFGRKTLEEVFLDVVRGRSPAASREARERDRSGEESVMSTLEARASGAEPILLPPTGLAASFRRIGALVRRYMYLLRSSGVRLVELIYWPFLQMLTWGFLQKYLAGTTSPLAQGAGVLIGSVLLWDILFRSKIGFSTTFIEEMWSRNLGNLLTSPLRPYELVAALSLWSVIRLGVSMVPVAIAAYFIFGFNLLDLGLPLAAFFAVLVLTSWSLGLISAGVILRYGLGAEELAWSLAFLLAPALLRLLSRLGAAGLAPGHRARSSADPCVRRHALDPPAPHLRREGAVVGAFAQRRLSARRLSDLQPVPRERAGQRNAAAAWRIDAQPASHRRPLGIPARGARRRGRSSSSPGARPRPKVETSGKALIGGPFALVDQTGKPVTDKDFRGRYMLVFFGFTHCPDVCPAELQVMADALGQLGPKAAEIVPVFITLDPERDTPEVVGAYVKNFGPNFVGLTGSPEAIAAAAKAYRVAFSKFEYKDNDGQSGYSIDHSTLLYLDGQERRLYYSFQPMARRPQK